MFRRSYFPHFIWLALASVGAGCATGPTDDGAYSYDRPYALIEPGTPSNVRRELPVFVHQVDGQIPVAQRYGVPVQPGKHQVEVHFASGTVEGNAERHKRTIDIDAAPCTRYRIVAHHTGPAHLDWEPVVYPEPIGECNKRFAKPAGVVS
jgi:hypothetical protein